MAKKLHLYWDGKAGNGTCCHTRRRSRVTFAEPEFGNVRFTYKGKEIQEDDPRLCRMCIALLLGRWHMPYEKEYDCYW